MRANSADMKSRGVNFGREDAEPRDGAYGPGGLLLAYSVFGVLVVPAYDVGPVA